MKQVSLLFVVSVLMLCTACGPWRNRGCCSQPAAYACPEYTTQACADGGVAGSNGYAQEGYADQGYGQENMVEGDNMDSMDGMETMEGEEQMADEASDY